MLRISQIVKKLEDRLEKKYDRLLDKGCKKLKEHGFMIFTSWYVYGMFINSIILGIDKTFPKDNEPPINSLIVINPFRNLFAIFTPTGIGVTFFCALMICLITKKGYSWFSGYKFSRDPRGFDILPDGTHGTADWMSDKEIVAVLDVGKIDELGGTILGKKKEYVDDDDKYSEYLSMKKKSFLNRHIMVYGASGSGKSRGFVKPFLLQAIDRKESIICVDPKGELFEATAQYAKDNGFIVKSFNLLDMENSDGFNCLCDIEDDNTLVQTIANIIIKNTSNVSERQDFWEKAELNLLTALIHYVYSQKDKSTGKLLPIYERSIGDIYNLLSTESFVELEARFAQLPKNHPAQAPYGIFKLANRQIWGNIAIGLGNRLSVFQNKLVDTITRHNDIDLILPGTTPCVYFCIISAQDSSLEFLSSLFFSLLFTKLQNYARKNCPNAKLPIPVNIMLEEFCNVGYLADFKRTISVCRSYNIHCQVIIQGIAQLSDRYPKHEWEELVGNCDTQIFLGCNDAMTADYISEKCGMVTIRVSTSQIPMQPLFSPIYNGTKPYTQGRSNTQRPLMLPDELLRLDNSQEIILIRGQQPLQLYKIIPDELPAFAKLTSVRVTDHIPKWHEVEKQRNPQPLEPPTRESTVYEDVEDARFHMEEQSEPPPISKENPPTEPTGVIMKKYTYRQVSADEILNSTTHN